MLRVLVVDDSKIMRNVICRNLAELGYKVVGQAECGHEAVRKYKILKPDFVTMDITMPEIQQVSSGIEAVRLIKEFDNNAIIIMITSHGEESKVIQAISNGAKAYLLKPITITKLKNSLLKIENQIKLTMI